MNMVLAAELELAEKVRALLKSENIALSDKEAALKSLAECVSKTACQKIYLKHVLPASNWNSRA